MLIQIFRVSSFESDAAGAAQQYCTTGTWTTPAATSPSGREPSPDGRLLPAAAPMEHIESPSPDAVQT